MSYSIDFTKSAKSTLEKWKKSNPKLYKKTSVILDELVDHPTSGSGHPEPLVGCGNVTYSRRISANERIVYDVYNDVVKVLVLSIEGHYGDK